MKIRFCQVFAMLCILAIGFIGLFPLAKRTEAHPSHKAYRHTTYYCYVIESSGLGEICTSYTYSGYRAVWPPDPHYTDGGTHIPHSNEKNTHDYDTERYTRSSCSEC